MHANIEVFMPLGFFGREYFYPFFEYPYKGRRD